MKWLDRRLLGCVSAAALAAILPACSGDSAPGAATSAQPSSRATAASPTIPSAGASVPVCRLPVGRPEVQPGNPYLATGYVGGFIDLPAGRYSEDGASRAILDQTFPGIYTTTAPPVLRGADIGGSSTGSALTFDAAFNRWLPVPSAFVSPDGARYAYVDVSHGDSSTVHVVDVKTGADLGFAFPGPGLTGPLQFLSGVVAFGSQGVYLTLFGSKQGPGPDAGKLWLLRPDDGTIRKVTDISGSWFIAEPYGWILLPTAGSSNAPNRLFRLVLATGQLSEWWADSNWEPVSSSGAATSIAILGADGSGDPIVEGRGEIGPGATYTPVFDLWVVKAPDHAVALDVSAADYNGDAITWDGLRTGPAGTWIALNDILFFYGANDTFVQAAKGPYSPAGPCRPVTA